MRKRLAKKSFLYVCVFIVTSCVTINVYFPAAAVEKAADRFVDEVWGDESTEPKIEDEQKKEGERQSIIETSSIYALSIIGPQEASAQEIDINITTPAIRALKDSIQQRAESIKPFMDRGNVGIRNDGLLTIRTNTGLNLKEKAHLTRLIDAENKDRKALYREIAQANNFSPDKIPEINKIFAGSWIKNARGGWWVQNPEGDWSQK